MQEKKRPGDENDMHSVVMSYDDLWPGIEERLLAETPPAVDHDQAELGPGAVDHDHVELGPHDVDEEA